jgi:hypothetical protein
MDPKLKEAEEQKRNRNYDPKVRWQHMMDFIDFIVKQRPELNRNRPRYRDENGKVHFY